MGTLTEHLYPRAAGTYAAIPSVNPAGGAHWEAVNDPAASPNDSDNVYILSGTPQADTYLITAFSKAVSRIVSVEVVVRAYSGGAGGAFSSKIRTHSTDYSGAVYTDTSYVNKKTTYTTNPNTGIAWTLAEIAALEIGLNLQGTGKAASYCSQVYAIINYVPAIGAASLLGLI